MGDEDIVMESTTDSPEQIAAGLGVTLDSLPEGGEPEAAPAEEPVAAEGDAEPVAADAGEEAEPVGEVTPQPNVGKTTRAPRPQRKTVDGAAAAARRQANGKIAVLETENEALKRRLAELTVGQVAAHPAGGTETPVAARTPVVTEPVAVDPSEIPDTHPEVAKAVAQRTALGAKPKQEDFDSFDAFEEARDAYIEARARIGARIEFVREDVARRESIARTEANRAAQETVARFSESVEVARAAHADYDEKMEHATRAGWTIGGDLRTALLESPVGGEVTYYLVSNPEELARINSLSPHRAIAALGAIEDRIQAAGGRVAPQATRQPVSTPRPAATRTTRAPEPQKVLLGDFSGSVKPVDLNDPNISLAEYNRARDEMDIQSGRRVRR